MFGSVLHGEGGFQKPASENQVTFSGAAVTVVAPDDSFGGLLLLSPVLEELQPDSAITPANDNTVSTFNFFILVVTPIMYLGWYLFILA